MAVEAVFLVVLEEDELEVRPPPAVDIGVEAVILPAVEDEEPAVIVIGMRRKLSTELAPRREEEEEVISLEDQRETHLKIVFFSSGNNKLGSNKSVRSLLFKSKCFCSEN